MRIPSETTPVIVTEEIRNASKTLVPGGEIIAVRVSADKTLRKQNCFPNVQDIVLREGGACITGWVIWQWANILIDFEAHAVWQKPSSELVDITPHEGEDSILFLPDPSIQYNGHSIPSKRFALTSSTLVAEMIKLLFIRDDFLSRYPVDTKIHIDPHGEIPSAQFRLQEIYKQLRSEVTRNDPCPCKSGLKFKNCCGRGA